MRQMKNAMEAKKAGVYQESNSAQFSRMYRIIPGSSMYSYVYIYVHVCMYIREMGENGTEATTQNRSRKSAST